jgi:hypothetical protein
MRWRAVPLGVLGSEGASGLVAHPGHSSPGRRAGRGRPDRATHWLGDEPPGRVPRPGLALARFSSARRPPWPFLGTTHVRRWFPRASAAGSGRLMTRTPPRPRAIPRHRRPEQACRGAVLQADTPLPAWARHPLTSVQRYAHLERCEPVLRGHSPRGPPLADRSDAIPEPSVTVRRNAITCGPEELSHHVHRTHHRDRDRA